MVTLSQSLPRQILRSAILLAFALLTLGACRPESSSFRPPTRMELDRFARGQGIEPISTNQSEDSAIVLYEQGHDFGFYTVSVSEPGDDLVWSNVITNKSSQPVSVLLQPGEASTIIAVLIQNQSLVAETTAIEVLLDSGDLVTVTTAGSTGAVSSIPIKGGNWKAVTLYRADGEAVYSAQNQ
jgi:hypothetical protein